MVIGGLLAVAVWLLRSRHVSAGCAATRNVFGHFLVYALSGGSMTAAASVDGAIKSGKRGGKSGGGAPVRERRKAQEDAGVEASAEAGQVENRSKRPSLTPLDWHEELVERVRRLEHNIGIGDGDAKELQPLESMFPPIRLSKPDVVRRGRASLEGLRGGMAGRDLSPRASPRSGRTQRCRTPDSSTSSDCVDYSSDDSDWDDEERAPFHENPMDGEDVGCRPARSAVYSSGTDPRFVWSRVLGRSCLRTRCLHALHNLSSVIHHAHSDDM